MKLGVMKSQVTIRFIELSDAEYIQQYAADRALAETCNVPRPYPEGGGQTFVEGAIRSREAGQRFAFAILCDDKFAGVMALNAVNEEMGTAALDYWVAVPFWRQGIGTAAAAQVIKYAFEHLHLSMLESCCLTDNIGSSRVLEKNRFVLVEEFVNDGESGNKFLGKHMKRLQLKNSIQL